MGFFYLLLDWDPVTLIKDTESHGIILNLKYYKDKPYKKEFGGGNKTWQRQAKKH